MGRLHPLEPVGNVELAPSFAESHRVLGRCADALELVPSFHLLLGGVGHETVSEEAAKRGVGARRTNPHRGHEQVVAFRSSGVEARSSDPVAKQPTSTR